MAQLTAHRNDLAFVMEGMGQHVVEDQCRSAEGGVSIGEMQFRICIELLIGQARQVRLSLSVDLLLEESGIRDGRIFGRVAIGIPESLQRVNPKSFAVEDMNHLFLQRREAEARQCLPIIARRDCGQVVEYKIEAGVGPAMEFPNAIESEHCSLLRDHNRPALEQLSLTGDNPGQQFLSYPTLGWHGASAIHSNHRGFRYVQKE